MRLTHKLIEEVTSKYPNEPHLSTILRRVNLERKKGCWFLRKDWSEYTTLYGVKAHRYMYQLFNPGRVIEGFFICHKCDRKGCINPDHLFCGTASDNVRDAIRKGRMREFRIK